MICDDCAYYDYDDVNECYVCEMNLDEDELYKFMEGGANECHYYTPYDEYGVVRKQN